MKHHISLLFKLFQFGVAIALGPFPQLRVCTVAKNHGSIRKHRVPMSSLLLMPFNSDIQCFGCWCVVDVRCICDSESECVGCVNIYISESKGTLTWLYIIYIISFRLMRQIRQFRCTHIENSRTQHHKTQTENFHLVCFRHRNANIEQNNIASPNKLITWNVDDCVLWAYCVRI